MANLAGDSPPGYAGLPRPPLVPGTGLDGLFKSWAQFVKLWVEVMPALSHRLARDTDGHRGSGTLPHY